VSGESEMPKRADLVRGTNLRRRRPARRNSKAC